MRRKMGMVVGLVLLGALVSCGDGDPSDDSPSSAKATTGTFTASGDITLTDSNIARISDDECAGQDGYDDMVGGTQVVIRDGDGTKVALGELDPGYLGNMNVICVFTFTVRDIPAGGGVYSVEVSHRGEMAFKEADASSLHLTLG